MSKYTLWYWDWYSIIGSSYVRRRSKEFVVCKMKFWKWHFIFEFVPILHFTVLEEYLKRNSLLKLTCEMTQKYSRFKSLYYLKNHHSDLFLFMLLITVPDCQLWLSFLLVIFLFVSCKFFSLSTLTNLRDSVPPLFNISCLITLLAFLGGGGVMFP